MQPDTIKYTTVLPVAHVEALKEMAARKEIPSINQGIRIAVERYLDAERKAHYAEAMRTAARDPEYLKRTMETQEAFSTTDGEGLEEW